MKTRIKIFTCKYGVEKEVNDFLESLSAEHFFDIRVNEYFIAVIYKDDNKRENSSSEGTESGTAGSSL